MKIVKTQQIEFSSLLFDTLFGLVLFFSIDSFLEIHNPLHFVLYVFSIVIVVHWWLEFKADNDAFDNEVSNSGLDLIVGIVEIIMIEYVVLMSRSFEYLTMTKYLLALLAIDLLWSVIWRYAGKWGTSESGRVQRMQKELNRNMLINSVSIIIVLALLSYSSLLSPLIFISTLIILYMFFVAIKIKLKIIDINLF